MSILERETHIASIYGTPLLASKSEDELTCEQDGEARVGRFQIEKEIEMAKLVSDNYVRFCNNDETALDPNRVIHLCARLVPNGPDADLRMCKSVARKFNENKKKKAKRLSSGAIAGISIGAVILLMIIIGLLIA